MNKHISELQKAIEPLRQQIIHHKVYGVIKDLDDLNIFMGFHVYAVWDFMSLLKSLQNNLTCTGIPWFPKGEADTRYLINEIVAGEESDVDQDGRRTSHFELYKSAMLQSGADVGGIDIFTNELIKSGDFKKAFLLANTEAEIKAFVDYTFTIIRNNKNHELAAVFTFGREDLIPGMFIALINDIHQNFPGSCGIFKYYLERHIEVDGDHHSNLALQMTANLCGEDEQLWLEARVATIQALEHRIRLWNGAYNAIQERSAVV